MINFEITSPTRAYFRMPDADTEKKLRKELSYVNTAASYDVKRHYNQNRWRIHDNEGWEKKLEQLKGLVKNTLIFQDDKGLSYIRPGSLASLPLEKTARNHIKYPTPSPIKFVKPLGFDLHPYQIESVKSLLEVRHGNVELCTGAGKSAIILKLYQETGFKTAVVAPSKSIFLELVKAFKFHFGKDNVGTYGAGKKVIGKRITVCIDDSLVNIKKGTEEWEFFSKLDMMIIDESHTWGAATLEDICHGIMADIPYRFFMSGTQARGDGAEKLLRSIIGKTVYTLTTREAIAGGYICPIEVNIVELDSSNPNINSTEPIEMKRIHFLNNKNIARFIAQLANASYQVKGEQTLILVEELSQIAMVAKLLTIPFAYAHSSKDPKALKKVGLEKVDTDMSVELFNKNEVGAIIGTSCIATGTNIYPTHNTANWVGGGSEVKTKQGAIGRSVRKGEQNPFKAKCKEKRVSRLWDFKVRDIHILDSQLLDRESFYLEAVDKVKRIKLDGQKIQTGGVR